MANRPNFIDLRPDSSATISSRESHAYLDLPSPKIGDVPPALSPLDALALHGRMLAKRFEEQNKAGQRISRLPPLTVENEFAKARPGYFRSLSADTGRETLDESPPENQEQDISPSSPKKVEVEPENRPKSQYPVIQHEEASPEQIGRSGYTPSEENRIPTTPHDYFSIPRSYSPEPISAMSPRTMDIPTARQPAVQTKHPLGQSYPPSHHNKVPAADSFHPRRPAHTGLAPPQSPAMSTFSKASPSIRSVPYDSSDDIDGMSLGGSIDSLPHPGFSAANISRSHSPSSPLVHPVPRSPSVSSESRARSQLGGRPSLNFSRPLSRPMSSQASIDLKMWPNPPSRQQSDDTAVTRPSVDNISRPSVDAYSRPSVEGLSRQDSGEGSELSFTREVVHTPVSMTSEDLSRSDLNSPAPSYIYRKYSLPRGRSLKRESINAADFLNQQFNDSASVFSGGSPASSKIRGSRPDSPATPPRTSDSSTDPFRPSVSLSDRTNSLDDQRGARAMIHKKNSSSVGGGFSSRPASPSIHSSNATVRPRSSFSHGQTPTPTPPNPTPATKIGELSLEEHLEIGIECHESGSLNKSTYHFRIAAKAGHPTAMLLYAMACRHGWGMRPNQAEGVRWLRKAVDSAQLEIADDEDLTTSTPRGGQSGATAPDALERKTHKAQFALTVYELGVSYMNGWGIQQDRALALRCFEIAGNWGDADALAEAGFCYTEGLGCKKDYRRAAKFYRMAEAKGMSMAGNSWIYKEKYMDSNGSTDDLAGRADAGVGRGRGRNADKEKDKSKKAKKPRSKSRTRSIFGRKKSMVGPPTPVI